MSDETIEPQVPAISALHLNDGVFEAIVTVAGQAPKIDLITGAGVIKPAALRPNDDGTWSLSVKVPGDALSDGTLAIVFVARDTSHQLASYVIRAGHPEHDNLADQVAVLRAEFDALKRAFLDEAWHEKMRKSERPVIVAEILEAIEADRSGPGTATG